MADTAKDVLETEIPAKIAAKPALLKEINKVFEFNLSGDGGGTWTLDCTEAGGGKVSSAASTAEKKVIINATAADFLSMATGKLKAEMAVMSGKLKVKPNPMEALPLKKLLG